MMLRKKWIIPVVFFVILMSACAQPKSLEFAGYKNLRLQTSGFSNSEIGIDLKYYNPNKYALQIKSADMNIFVNKILLGHFSQDSLFIIPAKDTFYYPLKMKINLLDLLAKIQQNNFRDSVEITAEGRCKVGRKGFFITAPVHYRVKRIFNFSAMREGMKE